MFTQWLSETLEKGISGFQFMKIRRTSLDDLWVTFPEQDLLATVYITNVLWRTQLCELEEKAFEL